jgi:hypothetical protein
MTPQKQHEEDRKSFGIASPVDAAQAMFEDDDDDDDDKEEEATRRAGAVVARADVDNGVRSFVSPEKGARPGAGLNPAPLNPAPLALSLEVDDGTADGMAAASADEACVIYLAGRPLCHNALLCALWVRAVQVASRPVLDDVPPVSPTAASSAASSSRGFLTARCVAYFLPSS